MPGRPPRHAVLRTTRRIAMWRRLRWSVCAMPCASGPGGTEPVLRRSPRGWGRRPQRHDDLGGGRRAPARSRDRSGRGADLRCRSVRRLRIPERIRFTDASFGGIASSVGATFEHGASFTHVRLGLRLHILTGEAAAIARRLTPLASASFRRIVSRDAFSFYDVQSRSDLYFDSSTVTEISFNGVEAGGADLSRAKILDSARTR